MWQHSRDPDAKSKYNKYTNLVKGFLKTHKEKEWVSFYTSLKPNDPKHLKFNKLLVNKNNQSTFCKDHKDLLMILQQELNSWPIP